MVTGRGPAPPAHEISRAARVAGGHVAAVERALVRVHGYAEWEAAAAAATLRAQPPERVAPLLDRIAARRVGDSTVI